MTDSTNQVIAAWQPRVLAIATAASDSDGAHDSAHLHRVWANARALMAAAPEDKADALIVLAACYLHDLVNVPKTDPRRAQASRLSAVAACAALAASGFPADLLDGVAHAMEARIVQDADRLDALGAVGLARLFYTAGRIGSSLAHGADPLALHRPLDDRSYALDHIVAKLAALPAMMQTAAGRALAHERLTGLLAFREQFAREWSAAA